jgi:hypothetical protein
MSDELAGASSERCPSDPVNLLSDKDIFPLWQARNFKANRFSVQNLDLVIGEIGLEHTKSEKFFKAAETRIEQYGWKKVRNFEYKCSHTHIYPKQRSEARRFGHAATSVVALEIAASELVPGYNVYSKLRILPATYFVDLFDRTQLEKARKADPQFDTNCLRAIGQEFDGKLLDQHSWGLTLTKQVATRLAEYLKSSKLDVRYGAVRCVGDPDQRSSSLGTKNRASDLTLSPTLDVVPPIHQ